MTELLLKTINRFCLKNMPLTLWSRLWQQHDEGPPNFRRQVAEFLKDNTEERRIGWYGSLGHPTWTRKICLWGCTEYRIYQAARPYTSHQL